MARRGWHPTGHLADKTWGRRANGRFPVGSLLGLLLFGFVMGMRHATDADHVVAVHTIVAREGRLRAAARIGILWGLGHTLTIVAVGGAIVVLGLVIPARLGLSMEMGVAVMLVVLGGVNLVGATRHLHDAATGQHPKQDSSLGIVGALRPLAVGVVHGLAGSAAVALLVLGALKDARWAMAYLLVFGAGTLAGMTLLTTLVAWPMQAAMRRFQRADLWLARVSGAMSIAFGIYLAYRIGVVDGLFSAQPRWTPE